MSSLEEPAWLWALFRPAATARLRLPVGARLAGQYTLEAEIGAGGFGVVYRAHDQRLRRPVAIKVLDPTRGPRPEAGVPRALREARAAARISDPGIVVVHDVGWIEALDGVPEAEATLARWHGTPFIVTELLDGASLRDLIARHPPPLPEAVRIAAQVAATLARAHEAGLAHGDVKPENIWLDPAGRVKLLDFGLARAMAADGAAPDDDDADAARGGTPGYLAPEGCGDDVRPGPADVWSLGQLLHELTGARAEAPVALAELVAECRAPALARRPAARAVAVQLERLRDLLADDAPASRDAPPDACPYPGLRAFEEGQARYYFGRAPDLAACLERWSDARPWLSIEGASGSGKSSLVQAGLLPALRRASGRLRVVSAAPDAASLTAARDELRAVAIDDPEARRVLVIDAFEAVFGPDVDRRAADEALTRVMELEPPVRLVTTLRADFTARLGELPETSARLNRAATRYVLGPLSTAGLREAIHGPAALGGLRLAPDLVHQLVLDASQVDGSLPLLAHVLRALWARRAGDRLTLEDYDDLGHLGGALSAAADRALARLGPAERAAARRVMLALCTIDESGRATRRPAALELAVASTELPDGEARALIDRLSSGTGDAPRLLRVHHPDGAATGQVELVHDALLVAWSTLAGWVREAALALRARHDLVGCARAWAAAGSTTDGVARGAQLTYFEGAAPVDGVAARYLAASQRERARASRADAWRRGGAFAAVTVACVTLSGLLGWGLSERAEQERRRQRSVGIAKEIAGAVAQELTPVPGTVAARAHLLRTAEGLVEPVDERPDALASRAALLYQRGRLARSRGDHPAALQALEAAAAAQRRVVAVEPTLEHELALSHSLEMLHWEQLTLRDHRAALDAAQEMSDRLEAATARGADDLRLLVRRARAYKLMARFYELEVSTEAALRHYRRALALLEGLPGAEAEANRINVTACVGNVQLAQGDYAAARRSYRRALRAQWDPATPPPTTLDGRRDLLWLHLGLGRIALEAGEHPEAQEELQAALGYGRANAEAEAALDSVYGIDLATVLHELALAEVGVGALDSAEAHATEAEAIARRLAAAEPLRHGILSSRARHALAHAALARGQARAAVEHIDAAVRTFEAPAGRRPTNKATAIIHARLLLTQAEALTAAGRRDAARAARARVVEIIRSIAARDPLDRQAADALRQAQADV